VSVREACWSGGLFDRGHPEVAGEGTVDGLESTQPVSAGGVTVGANREPGRRTVFGLVAAGDLQLGLDRPECPLHYGPQRPHNLRLSVQQPMVNRVALPLFTLPLSSESLSTAGVLPRPREPSLSARGSLRDHSVAAPPARTWRYEPTHFRGREISLQQHNLGFQQIPPFQEKRHESGQVNQMPRDGK
jgi:hypothetical protein